MLQPSSKDVRSYMLYYLDFFFPTFNIADTAISVGAILLIIEMFIKKKGRDEHGNNT